MRLSDVAIVLTIIVAIITIATFLADLPKTNSTSNSNSNTPSPTPTLPPIPTSLPMSTLSPSPTLTPILMPPPTPTTGSISISSSPSGASIYLDMDYQGVTPKKLENIEPGFRVITLKLTGYQDWSEPIHIDADKTTYISQLLIPPPTTGDISVSSSPSGASIYLDGDYQGKTPMVLENIELGSYVVTLNLTGYQNESMTIQVDASKTTKVSAKLTPFPTLGTQTVRVQLDGAFMHGFFTTNGYIITMTLESFKNAKEVTVIWTINDEKKQGQADLVKVGSFAPMASLLKLADTSPPKVVLPIRISKSLQQGDKVLRYLGPYDITPGTVLEVGADREIFWTNEGPNTLQNLLVTTSIAGPGDAGAPVIDTEGKVVAMVIADNGTESYSIPIEDIKADFRDAFPS